MTDPIMANNPTSYPDHYVQTVRTLLRFALIMMIVSLLSGILFQESSKKLPHQPVAEGFSRWDATVHLALVHGHAMMIGVLVPVALAGMLHLARACGGRTVNPRPLALARRLYLPAAAATLALMLYKSYHILLSARWGKTDPQQIPRRALRRSDRRAPRGLRGQPRVDGGGPGYLRVDALAQLAKNSIRQQAAARGW
jgi:hypothetical protein